MSPKESPVSWVLHDLSQTEVAIFLGGSKMQGVTTGSRILRGMNASGWINTEVGTF